MISAHALEKRYGSKWALRPLDLDVERGAFVVVTGRNGSGKTTLLRLITGLAAPTRGRLDVDVDRSGLGYLAHEALVYRDLTALENLDLYGRLYRVRERRERIGMLLERYGLWDVRHERAGSFSRGMLQRLALCRALLHEPRLLVLDEPFTALDAEGAILLDGQLADLADGTTVVLSTHDPARVEARRDPARRTRMTYFADVATLARKDLRLELRARDTLPAMLLFVVSTLVVFRFALPEDADEVAAQGLLWVALVFTALLGLARAWAPERESGALEGLTLAPCDRSAIWLGKAAAVFVFLAAIEVVALPAFAVFFSPLDLATVAGVLLANVGICAIGTLLAAMAAASRTRELILPLLFLPLAIPLVVGGVGASISDEPGRFLAFLGLYDAVFAILCWASFEYVVSE